MYTDFVAKLRKLRDLLQENNVQGLLITLQQNFAWLTCGGRNYVGIHSEKGIANIYIDENKVALLTNNIEAPRIVAEELKNCLVAHDGHKDENHLTIHFLEWYDTRLSLPIKDLLKYYGLITCDNVLIETDESSKIVPGLCKLRMSLTETELSNYRILGRDCGQIISNVARSLKKNVTESEVASQVAEQCFAKNIIPVVLLIAADDRIDKFRHPLPAYDKVAHEKIMLVLCGRRYGLIASVTRIVHFGAIPDELRRKHEAVTYVDAVAYANTLIGKSSSEVFKAIKNAYEEKGYPDEWKLHHQGGASGYVSREWRASPTSSNVIIPNCSYAWNPSIGGIKSEDTILLLEDGSIEVITNSQGWPAIRHEISGKVYQRPDILLLE
jgi:Xaa-Pro aminopeptidase